MKQLETTATDNTHYQDLVDGFSIQISQGWFKEDRDNNMELSTIVNETNFDVTILATASPFCSKAILRAV